jgi:hypothetical protein
VMATPKPSNSMSYLVPPHTTIKSTLVMCIPPKRQETLADFLIRLYSLDFDLHFANLGIHLLIYLDAVDGVESAIHR